MSTTVTVLILPRCDFCQSEGQYVLADYDGKTRMGPWANMCVGHFLNFGMGLGTGLGQRLVLSKEGARNE